MKKVLVLALLFMGANATQALADGPCFGCSLPGEPQIIASKVVSDITTNVPVASFKFIPDSATFFTVFGAPPMSLPDPSRDSFLEGVDKVVRSLVREGFTEQDVVSISMDGKFSLVDEAGKELFGSSATARAQFEKHGPSDNLIAFARGPSFWSQILAEPRITASVRLREIVRISLGRFPNGNLICLKKSEIERNLPGISLSDLFAFANANLVFEVRFSGSRVPMVQCSDLQQK